jgi:outer membrane autotransporter protein
MRGTAEGKTVADASATSNSTATGIHGGSGEDDITNMANISASIDSHAKAVGVSAGIAVSVNGKAEGAVLSDVSAESFSSAIGIDGGADNDRIENQGSLDLYSLSDSQTTAVSVSLTGTMGGVAEGKSVSDGSARAISRSTGIAGGEGEDIITSSINKITTFSNAMTGTTSVSVTGGGSIGLAKNAAVANASSISEAHSTGIEGDLGNDIIVNASEIKSTAKADAEATSTTVGVTIGIGAAETIGTGNSSATAKANSTGIEGGEGNDRITNTAKITTGGLETMGPMASAHAGATSVTVGIAAGLNVGEASSNSAAIAEVNTAGISAGSGDDWIYNTGDIAVGPDPGGTGSIASASAKSTTVDISVTVGASLGKSSSDTSSTAVANLEGISGGSGNDTVYNSGSITVGRYFSDSVKPADALATANAGSETVKVGLTIGGSFSDASSNASATAHSKATGIETGLSADVVNNTGVINTFSSSEALSTAEAIKVALTIGALEGAVESDASTLSTALATGIDSGEDADKIDTKSDFVVKALSTSATTSKAEDLNILSIGSAVQSATANSSSSAEAFARGINGGTGADTITAAGNYEVSADTEVSSTSRSSTVTGLSIGENIQNAQALAGTTAQALAVGIDGGEGNDVINNSAALMVNTSSSASTTGVSAANTGFNIAGTSSGESVAGATSDVTATGIGIRGGTSVLAVNESDADVIINEGMISVTSTVSAKTQSTSTADSITFIGAAEGTAISDASARVLADGIGIDGGADKDTITSRNTITVKSKAEGSVTSTSNVDSYATFGGASSMGVSDASANVLAEATGISGGTGDDIITSLALIEVVAESVGSVSATSDVDAVVTFGGASSKAASDASVTKKGIVRGIDGGDGDDVITNYDALKVSTISAGTVTSKSIAGAKATFGSTSSMTTTAAALEGSVDAAGIIGGSGDDWIKNLGRVDSLADATLQVNNSSMATAKSTFGSSNARAFSVSTLQGKASSRGVSGDSGDDLIENDGMVDVSAIANTTVNSFTVAIAKSFWGNESTEAASSNYAAGESTAEGVTAGAGNDKIVNKGLVTVEAGGEVKVNSLTVSSDGPAYSDAGTLALAYAKGIDGGAGDDGILNTDTVFVKAKPSISSATRTFGGSVNGKVGILLNGVATGITGGEGNDAITNEGNVLAFAGVQETASTISEDAASGSTTIKDDLFPAPADPQALVGKWIRITGTENPDFITQVVAFDPQTGTFTLRDPLKYDLPKDASYALYDYGQKTPDITSVNVTVGGSTRVDASTTASVQAIGIEGNDQSSVTDASDAGLNVFTDISRKGEDPEAIVGKVVLFKSGSSTDFATLVTAFDPDTGAFTLVDPLPPGGLSKGDIYTLGGGRDSIANLGTIDVRADSAINASSWSLTFGSADIDGRGWAQGFSAGVRGGAFNDSFQNYGGISARSTADVSSTDRVLVAFGRADQKISFEASSHSVGVDASAGDDEFINAENSSIHAEAASKADVNGVTTTFLAEVKNSVNAIADSTALGLDLGKGNNVAYNEGEFRVSANATTNAQAISDTVQILGIVFNETDADADAIAKASAWGIRAGSDEDQIFSRDLIQVNASADATSFARGSKVGSEDDTSTVTKDSDEGSKTFVDASLIPAQGQDPPDLVGKWVRFLTGENEDFFTRIEGFDPSTGTITLLDELPGDLKAAVLDDEGHVITPADAYTFSAARNGTSASVASALATGIDVGDGNAVVENTGVIRVKAFAKANTTAQTFGGQATAQANSSAEARGIRTGTGDDVIRNAGVIDVVSEVVTTTSGASPTEIAIATGIDAGEGNNKIVNEGEINVTASAGRSDAEVEARGIITGGGNDTILNGGKIETSVTKNGYLSDGVGIDSGAGNDTVVLANGSSIIGRIELGGGNDSLTFAGGAKVTGLSDAPGSLNGGPDTDWLVFDGAGSFMGSIQEFENTTKQGFGTYTVANLPPMQRIEIKEGTLEVNNNYQFSNDGSFETFVKGDGSFGQFKVNGTTELAGDLSVLKGPGRYKNGTTYNIIEAAGGQGVNGAFGNILLPETKPLLRFDVHQLFNAVEVEAHSSSFTAVATNRVERAIANYLDRIMPTAAGDLSNVLGEFQSLSLSQFGSAFSSLSPDSYDNYTRATYDSMWQYTRSLQRRLSNIRTYGSAAGYDPESKPLLLAFAGSDASLGQLLATDRISQAQAKNGLWFNGYGQWGDQEPDKGFTGFDYNIYGGTLGFDHAFNEKMTAGLSLGYSRTDVDLDHHQGDGSIKTFTGSLYGSYFTRNAFVEGAVSYGRNWYDNTRLIAIGPILRKASSDHDGNLFSAYLGGGYGFDIRDWMIGPFASLRYIYLSEESFRERGADSLNLTVDHRNTNSLTSELGLRLARIFKTRYGSLIPEASAAWSYDFDIDDRIITASFDGFPGAAFSIDGQPVERNGAVLGTGLTFIHKSGLSTSLRYRGEFREKYRSHGVIGELRLMF